MSQRKYKILDPKLHDRDLNKLCALIVMAKVPKAGRVKTRLSPPLSPEQAAALNIAFLRDTIESLEIAGKSAPAIPVVSYMPAGEEEGFRGIVPDHVPLILQRGEGFGERLLYTAEDALSAGFGAVCLIDSDSPTVPTEEYIKAAQYLFRDTDCGVLGPSDDGGYYLLGMNALHPRLFAEITWSTSAVAAQTRERAGEIALPLHELKAWFDVDDEPTLTRLQQELASETDRVGFSAKNTRKVLREVTEELTSQLTTAQKRVG
jgi:uncharacterized protein